MLSACNIRRNLCVHPVVTRFADSALLDSGHWVLRHCANVSPAEHRWKSYIGSIFKNMPVGTRIQVWRRTKTITSGGLRRNDLKLNKRGKLVSRRVSKQQIKRSNLGAHLTKKPLRRSKRIRKKAQMYMY